MKSKYCFFSQPLTSVLKGDSLQGGDDSPFSDSITLEQTTSNIGVSSGRVSLWMQWMLPKITIKLFAPDPRNNGTGIQHFFLTYYFKFCTLFHKTILAIQCTY